MLVTRGKPLAIFYSPAEYKKWQADADEALKKVQINQFFDGPVVVRILAVAERPKTTKLLLPKPDVDNYAKGVLDAVTKAEKFWRDDTQVADLSVSKRWSRPGRKAGIHVSIYPLPSEEL